MKAKALFCLCCIAAIVGCTKDDTIMLLSMQEQNRSADTRLERNPFDLYKFSDSTIVLGAKLDNPYSVANLQIARDSLIAEGASPSLLPVINVTHYYARFKPDDDDALANLIDSDTTIVYYEFPLDYKIKEYGVSYHDPSIADTLPTYQYASVPIAKWQNLQDIPNVECTLLEPLCILDEDKDGSNLGPITPIDPSPFDPSPRDSLPFKPVNPGDTTKLNSNNGLNRMPSKGDDDESVVSALMSKSFELTGNGDYEEPSMTRASSKWQPAGNIYVYNDVTGFIPLVGAKVLAKRWFTTYSGITDGLGNFTCNGKSKNPVNYCIKWQRGKYSILDGSVCQAYYNGPKIKGNWNLDITDGKSVRFATIHRAAHLMFYGQKELSAPKTTSKLTIKYFHTYKSGLNGDYNSDVKRLRIWGKNKTDKEEIWRKMSEILSTTFHELGHAAHNTNAKNKFKNSERRHKESWARFVQYYLTYLEYENWGMYEAYCPWDDNNECYEPDLYKHNRQKWNINLLNDSDKDLHSTYTPIYIDLYDNFNQQTYYQLKGFANYLDYPDDNIHIDNVQKIEYFVFNTTSFTDIKNKLLDYKNYFIVTDYRKFGITEENINKLFCYYE